MKTTFETPQEVIARLSANIEEYNKELWACQYVILRHNWCVVDADFELFAVKKNAANGLTFGDDADFYTIEDAKEIAAKAIYKRNDNKRVNLKVMSTRDFFEMKKRHAEETIAILEKNAV